MPLFLLPALTPQILPYIELRERYERRLNRDFVESSNDGRTDLLSRWRVGANLRLNHGWTGEIRYQFAEGKGYTEAADTTVDNSDVDLAYVKRGGLTLGRQKIALAGQRLVGPLEWVNVPRSFDGVRYQSKGWDFSVSRIGVGVPRPRHAVLGILANTNRYGTSALIYKHDDAASGRAEVATLNHSLNRKFRAFSLEAEGALQAGRTAGKDLAAWALHARVSRSLNSKLGAFVEGNAASGGNGPTTVRTFDNLYPTNHPFYGIMDLQGWRNMTELALGLEMKLRADLTGKLSYHRFGLMDASDAWYGAGGAPNARPGGLYADPTGNSGRDTGQEWDLEATYTPKGRWSFGAGIAFFQPGDFVKNVAGASTGTQTWGFVQAQVRF